MNRLTKYVSAILSLAVLATSIWGIYHYQQILDYFALRSYDPPVEIQKLATETTMKDGTRRVFYINHPQIEPKTDFIKSCSEHERTIVLGCYVGGKGIYLLDVSDPKLNGIIEVTAAHEVLHAMYDRLSDSERADIDRQTTAFFDTLNNDRIKKNIENYRANDPTVVPNELHSILATEVRDLPPGLETYYSRYFSDRKAIVAYSEKYEQTFVSLEKQATDYKNQLDTLKQQIDDNEASLDALGKRIDEERDRLDSQLHSGQVEQYNTGVAGFNGLVNQYNSLIQQRKNYIEQYNKLVEQYNDIATQETQLQNSLKGIPQEVPDKAVNQ